MAKADRIKIIRDLENERGGTHLISYVTSTRNGLEVQMAMDSIRKIYDHLKLINKPKDQVQIDLFLYSNGGDGIVPWKLVTLIREYCSKLSVLVPHRAFSAATLTALGADSIVMHQMGMLGPTDPTVTNPFNPVDGKGNPQGISVEDVSAYIALIKEDADIHHEDEFVQAFNMLASKVHPLALGNVKRSLSQSRMMARKLLSLHMDSSKQEHEIEEIVDNLTSKLFYHGHPINRTEARDQVKLPTIVIPSKKIEELMWNLYLEYEKEIKMEEPFNIATEFLRAFPALAPKASAITPAKKANLAYIESIHRTDVALLEYLITGAKAENGVTSATMIAQSQGWETE
jgi:Serine dehydrogenase proteinase